MSVERFEGVLRGAVPVTVVDLSRGGLQLEARASLRPGTTCELTARATDLALTAQVRITRCSASGAVPDGKGGRALVYRAGAEIVSMESPRPGELEEWLERRKTRDGGGSAVA